MISPLVGSTPTMEVDAAFHNGSVDQFWQSHMLEVHDSMGSNPIGTTISMYLNSWLQPTDSGTHLCIVESLQ